MKRNVSAALAFTAVAGCAAMAAASMAPGTGINGSWHDLNVLTGYRGDQVGRTCVFCHTPHNARKTDSLVPLWNHAETSLAVMTPYAWSAPTNRDIAIAKDPLIGPSRLCMACHDGSTAVDSHGAALSNSPGTTVMTAAYTDGLNATAKRYITDLTVTHPIGFLYEDAMQRRGTTELVDSTHGFITGAIDPNTWNTQQRGSLTESNKKIKDTLYGGYLTCASCHDVHNSVNTASTGKGTYNYFLYAPEEGSAICLSCHVK